jgi:hypothetical protein
MMLFVILFTSLLFFQAMSVEHDCRHTIYTSKGDTPNQQGLRMGEILTWSYPLMKNERRSGLRRTQERLENLKPLKALVEPRFNTLARLTTPPPSTLQPTTSPPNGTEPPETETEGEVGKWQGYCTGLGSVDPDYAQICHHIYTINNQGFFSGTNVYAGEDVIMVAITGGAGWLTDGSGGVNITYLGSEGTFYHDVNLCFV